MACHHITTSEIQNLPRTGTMDVHREIHSGTLDSPQCLTVTSERKSCPPKKAFFVCWGGGKVNWPIFWGSLSLFYVLFFWKRIVFLIRKLPVSQRLHLLIASVVESLLVKDFNHQKRYVSVGPLSPDMEKQWEISPKIDNFKPDPNGNHSSKFQLFCFVLPKVGDKPLRRCFGDTHLWIFEIMAGLQKLGDL